MMVVRLVDGHRAAERPSRIKFGCGTCTYVISLALRTRFMDQGQVDEV
jgi:hypothetical protein